MGIATNNSGHWVVNGMCSRLLSCMFAMVGDDEGLHKSKIVGTRNCRNRLIDGAIGVPHILVCCASQRDHTWLYKGCGVCAGHGVQWAIDRADPATLVESHDVGLKQLHVSIGRQSWDRLSVHSLCLSARLIPHHESCSVRAIEPFHDSLHGLGRQGLVSILLTEEDGLALK